MKSLKKRYMTLLELLIGMSLTMGLLSILAFFYYQIDQINTASEKTQKEIFHLQYVENRLNHVIPHIIAGKPNHFYFFTSTTSHGIFADASPSLIFQYETGTDLDDSRAVTALGRLFLDRNNRLCLATWPDPTDGENDPATLLEQSTARIEVLLEKVVSVGFQFYVAPDRDRSIVTNQKSGKSQTQEKSEEKKPPETQQEEANTPASRRKKQIAKEQEEARKNQEMAPVEPSPEVVELQTEPEQKGLWISEWDKKYKQLPVMIKIVVTQIGVEKPIIFAYPFLKSKKVIVYEQ